MSLFSKFLGNIQNENLFQKKDLLILAVSGGVDSIVLCELCQQAGFNFEIAHCNFQLRGEESERDEKFVKTIGDKYEKKVHIKKFDTEIYCFERKISIQVGARELRYKWFDELLNEIAGASGHSSSNLTPASISSYLLTAHHANDDIETLLMNFFKGTGIKGLRGILPKQGKIIRPLLFAKKEEIISFANENHLSFVEDSSNISDKYTRNFFRNQLIPSVQKIFPKVEDNLMDNITRFTDIEVLYNESVDLNKKKLLEYKGEEVHIPVLKLLKTKALPTVIYEIIKDYNFTSHQVGDILHLLKSDSGKYISSPTHKIIRNRKWLILAAHNNPESSVIIINEEDKEIDFVKGNLSFEKIEIADNKISGDNDTALLDADTFTFPLILRKWKQGDYFYPLGMMKKKKLSKFFIDQKMSLTDKENVWILESNKKIIWIIKKRIDERFKIQASTKDVIKIHFKEH